MSNKTFVVCDTIGYIVARFPSYRDAKRFYDSHNLPWEDFSWTIKEIDNQSTTRQRDAVHFCEEILGISFSGNIMNKLECSIFLHDYLDIAKQQYTELKCESEADRGY